MPWVLSLDPWLKGGFFPLLLVILVFVEVAGAATPEIKRTKAPGWVKSIDVDLFASKARGDVGAGESRLLIERQVNAAEATSYAHIATRFLTAKGVEEGAKISITFDPSYQTLTMHQLVIHRNGNSTDRLAGQEIKLIQRETRSGWNIYDGRLSAEIIPEDVRVGDVLEYAYSLRGWNPIFANHYLDSFYTDRDEAVHLLRLRLLWPSDRHLETKEFGAALAPIVTQHGDVSEYTWERRDLPELIADGQSPSWFEPWSWIQFSEFDSWAAVARWANEIYVIPKTVSGELENELKQIAPLATEEARVLAALRFVQDNIRYLGLEVGVNSHRPYPVETILARRFGDCKDKALLLCTMLRQLGFDAKPALVGTEYRQTISEWLPSPLAFDHLVVHLSLNGETFWLDPTRHDQGGPLKDLYFPALGWALVISPETTELTAVQPAGFATTSKEVVELFDFLDFKGDAGLQVITTWRGHEADKMRSYLAETSREEIQKDALNFYASLYPHVEIADGPQFRDDRDKNVFVAEEKYSLTGFWKADDNSKGRLTAEFTSQTMRNLAVRPTTRIRSSPYELDYPEKVVHRIEIDFPRHLNLHEERRQIDNPAFSFTYASVPSMNKFTASYAYESHSDHVDPGAIAGYLGDIDRMRDRLSFEIFIPKIWSASVAPAITGPADSSTNTAMVATKPNHAKGVWGVSVVAALAVIFGWRRVVSRRRDAAAAADVAVALHRCVVCGETEESDPGLEFRVATDGLDYCQRHLPSRASDAK